MKRAALVGILLSALPMTTMLRAQTAPPATGTSLGSVMLTRTVLADGKPLEPGTYQVRLTGDAPKPGIGQSLDGTRYVEFLRGGKVLGREAATVVSDTEVAQIAKGPRPARGTARVELLKGTITSESGSIVRGCTTSSTCLLRKTSRRYVLCRRHLWLWGGDAGKTDAGTLGGLELS
jgi:hypothetical protein